jgi:hypothetical protein
VGYDLDGRCERGDRTADRLPDLPIVIWPESAEHEERGLHWKTRGLVEWAAGRPFVWIDDEITDFDRAWVGAHHEGPALLYRVDPRFGLTDEDFEALGDWLDLELTIGSPAVSMSLNRRLAV